MIMDLMQKLGFNNKQTAVYLAVLGQGKATHSTVARLTKINRTTVYSVAKELVDKGLVAEDLAGTTSYLTALPAERLLGLVEREEKQLQEKRKLSAEAVTELSQLAKLTKYAVPKIVFVEEKNLETYLYEQTPVWNRDMEGIDSTWWGFQDPGFVRHYEKWIHWYWQTYPINSIGIKILTSQSEVERNMAARKYERRQVKFWNKSKNFTATTWVCGNRVIIINTSSRPHYLVEINDSVLAHNMRELFKGIWEDIPEPHTQ